MEFQAILEERLEMSRKFRDRSAEALSRIEEKYRANGAGDPEDDAEWRMWSRDYCAHQAVVCELLTISAMTARPTPPKL